MALPKNFNRTTKMPAGMHAAGNNLYLQVTPTGAMSWVFRYTAPNGKRREKGLGSATGAGSAIHLGLKEARIAADRARLQLIDGIDPVAESERSQRAARATFKVLLDKFLEVVPVRKSWTFKAGAYPQVAHWRGSLNRHAGSLLAMPVDDIDPAAVLAVVEPLWPRKVGEDLRNRIEQVLDYAKALGHRKGMDNAAAWEQVVGKLFVKPSKGASHKALDYAEMPAFWAKLASLESAAKPALSFVILNANRASEAREVVWEEIDMGAATWTIPGPRMKAKADHIVPLSAQSIALLKAQGPKASGLVFPGTIEGQPFSEATFGDVMRRMLRMSGKATVHGFRSTFRDWVGDETTFAREDVEMALAHSLGKVEAAYRRKTAVAKRRVMMQAWADYCHGVEKVTALKVAA